MIYISNAFSLNMLNQGKRTDITVLPLTLEEARKWASRPHESIVGHEGTAKLFSALLGTEIAFNRATFKVENSTSRSTGFDSILVGQYSGPRLEEGCTELPEGASIQWFRVLVTTRTK